MATRPLDIDQFMRQRRQPSEVREPEGIPDVDEFMAQRQEEPGLVRAGARGVWTGLKGVPEFFYETVRHPIRTGQQYMESVQEMQRRAEEAAERGETLESLGYSVAAGTPIVGPLAAELTKRITAPGLPAAERVEAAGEVAGLAAFPFLLRGAARPIGRLRARGRALRARAGAPARAVAPPLEPTRELLRPPTVERPARRGPRPRPQRVRPGEIWGAEVTPMPRAEQVSPPEPGRLASVAEMTVEEVQALPQAQRAEIPPMPKNLAAAVQRGEITLEEARQRVIEPARQEFLRRAGEIKARQPLRPAKEPTTVELHRDPAGNFLPERQTLHEQLIGEILADKPVSDSPTIYVLGGGTASGKTTLTRQLRAENPGAVVIDADAVKLRLPEFEPFKGENVRTASARVHEESKVIAKEVLDRAMDNRQDIILDATTSGTGKTALLEQLKKEGYRVKLRVIDIPIEEAKRRAELRARASDDPTNFGRVVPEEDIVRTHNGAAKNFWELKDFADDYALFDNGGEGPPRLVAAKNLEAPGEVVYDNGWLAYYAEKAGKPELTAQVAPEGALGLAPSVRPAGRPGRGGGIRPPAPVEAAAEAAPPVGRPVAGAAPQLVPLESIKTDPKRFQPRLGLQEGRVEAISESMRERGFDQSEPLVLWRDPTDVQVYVLAGHHRLHAAERAGVREAPSVVFQGTEAEALAYARRSNSTRAPLTPIEEARAFAREIEEGRTPEQVSQEYGGLKRSVVEDRLALNQLSPELQLRVQDGTLSLPLGTALGKAVGKHGLSPDIQLQIFDRVIKQMEVTPAELSRMIDTIAPRAQEQMTLGLGFQLERGFIEPLAEMVRSARELQRAKRRFGGFIKQVDQYRKQGKTIPQNLERARGAAEAEIRRLEGEVRQLESQLALGKPPRTLRAALEREPTPEAIPRPEIAPEATPGPPEAIERLVSHINRKDWWHVPPVEGITAYAARGKFLASSFKEAEFWGRPLDEAQRANIKNPVIGDEPGVHRQLFDRELGAAEPTLEQRFALDATMKEAALANGYDSIVIMNPKAYQEFVATGKIPRSLELNILEPPEGLTAAERLARETAAAGREAGGTLGRIEGEALTREFEQPSTQRVDIGERQIEEAPLFGGERQRGLFGGEAEAGKITGEALIPEALLDIGRGVRELFAPLRRGREAKAPEAAPPVAAEIERFGQELQQQAGEIRSLLGPQEELGLALGETVAETGTFQPKAIRPELRKPGKPVTDVRVSEKVLNQVQARFVQTGRRVRDLRLKAEQQADALTVNALRMAEAQFKHAFRDLQKARQSWGRMGHVFQREVATDLIAEMDRLGLSVRNIRNVRERMPVLDGMWEAIKAGDVSQFLSHGVDYLRINLFGPMSWSLDFFGDAIAAGAKTNGYLLADVFTKPGSMPHMIGLLRSVGRQIRQVQTRAVSGLSKAEQMELSSFRTRRGAGDILAGQEVARAMELEARDIFRLAPDLEAALGKTAGGEFLPPMTKKLGRAVDVTLSLPLRAKMWSDTLFKRTFTTAELYTRAGQKADALGLKGVPRQRFIEDATKLTAQEFAIKYKLTPEEVLGMRDASVVVGNEVGFNVQLSAFEEAIARNRAYQLLGETFARWPFQFGRWMARTLGADPAFWRKVKAGTFTADEFFQFVGRGAAGWGGVMLLNEIYDNVQFWSKSPEGGTIPTLRYLHEDGTYTRLAGRSPVPEGLFVLAILKGDWENAKALLPYVSLPGAKIVAGEPAGLLGNWIDSLRDASRGYVTPERMKREGIDMVNRAMPWQALLGTVEAIMDPTFREGVGAGIPGVSRMLPAKIKPTTGEELRPMQQFPPVIGPTLPAVGALAFPGGRVLTDPVEAVLLQHGIGVFRPRRAPLAEFKAEDVPPELRQEYQRQAGRLVNQLVSELIGDEVFWQLNFAERAQMLNETVNEARRWTRDEILYQRGELPPEGGPQWLQRLPRRQRERPSFAPPVDVDEFMAQRKLSAVQ